MLDADYRMVYTSNMLMQIQPSKRGFTLVELLVVIATI